MTAVTRAAKGRITESFISELVMMVGEEKRPLSLANGRCYKYMNLLLGSTYMVFPH